MGKGAGLERSSEAALSHGKARSRSLLAACYTVAAAAASSAGARASPRVWDCVRPHPASYGSCGAGAGRGGADDAHVTRAARMLHLVRVPYRRPCGRVRRLVNRFRRK